MSSLGLRLPLAFWLWLLPTCLSASSGGWASPQLASSPLVFAQSFVLWVGLAVPYVRAFCGKVLSLSLFSPSLWLSCSLGCYLMLVPSDCPQGVQAQSVLTLSSAAYAFLFSPRLLVVNVRVWATSPLGVAVRPIFCGVCCCFFFSSWLCCPLRPKTPHRPTGERVSWCLETSPPSQLPPWDGSLSLTLLSLFLSFIFCPTSFWRQWAAFLGAWYPLSVFRSCFVEFAQHSIDLLMNLLGRKWSPCPIPPPS